MQGQNGMNGYDGLGDEPVNGQNNNYMEPQNLPNIENNDQLNNVEEDNVVETEIIPEIHQHPIDMVQVYVDIPPNEEFNPILEVEPIEPIPDLEGANGNHINEEFNGDEQAPVPNQQQHIEEQNIQINDNGPNQAPNQQQIIQLWIQNVQNDNGLHQAQNQQ